METNKLNESLELVLGVVRKLHPHEANVVLQEAITSLIEDREVEIKEHRERESLLTSANKVLMQKLKSI